MPQATRTTASRRLQFQRTGAIVVLFAVFLVVMMALLAFSIDVGFIASMQTDLQRSADSAALAGARDLGLGGAPAITAARQFAKLNAAGTHQLVDGEVKVDVGNWNRNSRVFTPNGSPLDAIRVVTERQQAPFFFGRVLGRNTFEPKATAIATTQPRDIMLVLDYSGSMNSFDKVNQLKRAVRLFLNELQRQNNRDRVGFVGYSTNANLEMPLTFNLASVGTNVNSRSANGFTNIGEAMEIGRREMEKTARPDAQKLMMLLTDGIVNRPLDRDFRQYVIDEARNAKTSKIPVVTISFSSEADPSLMQQVADITNTVHFHVAGSVASQESQLIQVFGKVAINRPLQLVQ